MREHALDVGDVFTDWAQRGRGEGMEHGHRLTAGDLIAQLPLEPGTRMLDLGTGIAWACADAAERGATAVGIDVAPGMLQRARTRTAETGSGPGQVHLARALFEHLPFPSESFHVCFSMEALYYSLDLEATLAEIHRVLAPGGQLHALIDYYEENEASHTWPEKTGVAMDLRSEQGWLDALEQAGFHTLEASRLRSEDPEAEAWKREEGTLYLAARR